MEILYPVFVTYQVCVCAQLVKAYGVSNFWHEKQVLTQNLPLKARKLIGSKVGRFCFFVCVCVTPEKISLQFAI